MPLRPLARPLPVSLLLKTTYGANLIVNGTFDTDLTSWSNVNSPTLTEVSSGRAHVTGGSGSGIAQAITLVVGARYRIDFDYEVVSGGLNVTKNGLSPAIPALPFTGTGSYSYTWNDSGGGVARNLLFQCSTASSEFFIDNVRIRRVT